MKGKPIINLLDKGRLRKATPETIKKDLEFNVLLLYTIMIEHYDIIWFMQPTIPKGKRLGCC